MHWCEPNFIRLKEPVKQICFYCKDVFLSDTEAKFCCECEEPLHLPECKACINKMIELQNQTDLRIVWNNKACDFFSYRSQCDLHYCDECSNKIRQKIEEGDMEVD